MRNPLRALFDTRNIGNSHELLQLLLRGTQSKSGATVNEQTALNVAAVMTCVSLISRTVATLPLTVYERLGDGRSKQRAKAHPLLSVLSKPNEWQTRAEFVQMMQAHLLLRGNAYAWIDRSEVLPGVILQMVPLHPDRIEVEQQPDWTLTYTLTRKNGQKVPLPANEVLHLRGLSTDGVLGRSTLSDARELLGGAIATQDYAANFWKRDATPAVLLKHPKTLTDKAAKSLREQWEATYGGSEGKRVAVIEEGMEVERLSMTANDAQFLETRKFQRGEIAGWFHVPPHMIGDTEKSTSWGTGIEQQQIGFLTFAIRPWLVAWEQRMNRDLITNRDRFFVEFNVDGLLRGDATARSNFYARMVGIGALSPNEVRALENMNPTPDGDIWLQPTNMAPLGTEPAPKPAPRQTEDE